MKYFLLGNLLLYTATITIATCPSKCQCSHFLLGVYDSVECSNKSLTELPFGNLKDILGKLDLSFNEITVLKNDTFLERDIDFLDKLMLNNNKITTIEVNAFRGLVHLTYLNLRHNNITSIHSNVFQGVPELRILNLNNNPFLQLPNTGFALPKLGVLDLSACGLRSVPENFFVEMKNLDILTLSGNQLSFLDPSLVAPLSRLEYLDLQGNGFTRLQEDLLQLPQTIDIDFKGNPLQCNCKLSQVYTDYKRRAHNEMLVCHNPETTELMEPTEENLTLLKCFQSQQLNMALSTHGSLLAIAIITLRILLNNMIYTSGVNIL